MSEEIKKNESVGWKILYFCFICTFIILCVLFTQRLIAYPSRTIADITIFYPLVIIFLFIVMGISLIILFVKETDKNQGLNKFRLIIYYILLICVGALGWSLRGVWGHETGTLVWGTLVCSVLMLENKRDHWMYFLFFANIGLAIGANFPFATYPFIPRLVHFATWGMLGMFFCALGRYFFYRNGFESKEDFKKFHVQISVAGFTGLALGITFASALYINDGWTAGWLGGYVTGGFYALILGIFLYYNNKKFEEELNHPDYLKLFDDFLEPKTNSKKLLKIIMYIILFALAPVAGFINIANYYYFELQYPGFPALLIFILCVIYIVTAIVLILKYNSKLGQKANYKLELFYLFMTTLWLSSISAILRNDIGRAPDLIYIIQNFEFALSIILFAFIISILMIIYMLIDRKLDR